jgi:TnpA family transposase
VFLTNFIRVTESRREGRLGINKYKFWLENIKESHHLVDQSINARVILKQILQKYDVKIWTGYC